MEQYILNSNPYSVTVYVAHAQENSILSAIDFAEASAPLKLSLPVRCLRCVLIYYVL